MYLKLLFSCFSEASVIQLPTKESAATLISGYELTNKEQLYLEATLVELVEG